jgi:hypothetical protein
MLIPKIIEDAEWPPSGNNPATSRMTGIITQRK